MIASGFVKSCSLSTCGHQFYMIFLLFWKRMNLQSDPWYKYVVWHQLNLLLLLQKIQVSNCNIVIQKKKKKSQKDTFSFQIEQDFCFY